MKIYFFVFIFLSFTSFADTHPEKDIHLICENNDFNIHELISKHIDKDEMGVIPYHALLTIHLKGGENENDIIFYYLDPRGSLFEEKSTYYASSRNIILNEGTYWKSGYIDRVTLQFDGTYISLKESYSCELSKNSFQEIKNFQNIVELSIEKNLKRTESERKF